MTTPADPSEQTAGLYKAYLEDLGRIGSRHETLRQFYLSVISALFVFLALTGKEGALVNMRDNVRYVVGLVGVAICLAWFFHMGSFADLFKAKRETLRQWETTWVSFKPFTQEGSTAASMGRTRLTSVDRTVALIFVILFVALVVIP